MDVDSSNAASTMRFEALLSHVQGNLSNCILEHGRRMELAMLNQQVRLEACMRALGVEEPSYPFASTGCVSVDLSRPMAPPGTWSPLPPEPNTENGILAVVPVPGKPASQANGQIIPGRSSQILNRTNDATHHDLHPGTAQAGPRPSLRRSSSNVNGNGGKPTRLAALVEHPYFNHVIGLVILANGLFICIDADFIARNPGKDVPRAYLIIETVFFLIFLIELLLRICVYRWVFCAGEEWRWNWFDALVVVTAAIEETVKLVEAIGVFSSGDSAEGLTVFKLMRIMKLTRAIRIVRVVKAFRELRIMVMSIISTLRTLFWSIVCMVMIMAGFAVYLVTVVSDHEAMEGRTEWAQRYFGSMPAGMLSLFQASTGGMDWHMVSDGLWSTSPAACCAFFGYISMMTYAILNILTGICVNNANRAAEDDFDLSFHQERSKHKNVITSLKNILHGGDASGAGTITWSDLDIHLHNAEVRALFKKIDLEPWHLKSFFDMMGADEDEEEASIDIDQFIRGCMRLRCTVKNIDLMASRHDESEHSAKRLHKIEESVKQIRDAVLQNHAALLRLDHQNGHSSRTIWDSISCSKK